MTSDPERCARADRVVLPGVGAFADCRRGLDAVAGMVEALNETVRKNGRPFLGICVGMQLMAERGREYEVAEGSAGSRARSTDHARRSELKIPHMGWNTLDERTPHPLFDGIALGADGLHAYFVHSFHSRTTSDTRDLVARRGLWRSGHRDRRRATIMAGTQFHPEKSQRLGLALIAISLEVDSRVILFPAIDLKDGVACASSRATWRARPCSTAIRPRRPGLRDAGLPHLHVVDLDGAFAGKPMNVARSSEFSRRSDAACSSAAASATWRRSRAGSTRASTASSSAPPRCAIRPW